MLINHRNHGLDLLRMFAIVFVMLLHSVEILGNEVFFLRNIFEYGWIGVDLFFVLSGFLIAGQVFNTELSLSVFKNLKIFWIKRWLRTFPLYFFVLFVYLFIKPFLGYPFIGWNFSYLFFAQNYFDLKDFVQSWSLCIEEQFYLFLPILVFVLGLGKRTYVWLIPIAVSFICRYVEWSSGSLNFLSREQVAYLIDFPTHTHLDGLSLGVFLAKTQSSWGQWSKNLKLAVAIFGLFLLMLNFYFNGPYLLGAATVYSFSLIAVGFSCLLIYFESLKIHAYLYSPAFRIAQWSFGMYLWNNLLMRVLIKAELTGPWIFKVFVFFALTCILSWLSYRAIEKPFLSLRNKILAR